MNWRGSVYEDPQKPAPYYCYVPPVPKFQIAVLGMNISVQLQANDVLAVSSSIRDESRKRVEEFFLLKDGWDGYGAYAPAGVVCGNALRLVDTLAQFPNVPSPEITPSSNGTVLFSWENQGGEAILEVGETKFTGFIRKSGSVAPLEGDANLLGAGELSAISGYLG